MLRPLANPPLGLRWHGRSNLLELLCQPTKKVQKTRSLLKCTEELDPCSNAPRNSLMHIWSQMKPIMQNFIMIKLSVFVLLKDHLKDISRLQVWHACFTTQRQSTNLKRDVHCTAISSPSPSLTFPLPNPSSLALNRRHDDDSTR